MRLKGLLTQGVATVAVMLCCGYGWSILIQPSVAKTDLRGFQKTQFYV